MKKFLVASVLAVLGGFAAGPSAWAQGYGGGQPRPLPTRASTPGLSPYLDLTRNGDPAVNYYLGTLPEFQRRRFERSATQAIDELSRSEQAASLTANELLPPLPQTGHPTAFNNLGNYFNSSTGVTRPTARFQPAAPTPPKR